MCGCLSCTPNWGSGPQPRHVPWLGIKPLVHRPARNPLSHSSQGKRRFLSGENYWSALIWQQIQTEWLNSTYWVCFIFSPVLVLSWFFVWPLPLVLPLGNTSSKRNFHCIPIYYFKNILKCIGFREREREGDREREVNIDLFFHLFMTSLVDSGMCPDQGWNPWCIRMRL